jgi:ABC-type sugar transport system ATPase subunit
MSAADEVAIEALGVYKDFGHVQALRGASIAVNRGEIVGLVGDNGAGKSTLMKIMCGALQGDEGEIRVLGRPVSFSTVREAHDAGIDTVYQDLALAPDLSVPESIFLGHEVMAGGLRGRLGVLGRRQMARDADEALRLLGIVLPSVNVRISALSGGQRQAVAIARAVKWARKVILMDEPTAALGTRQTEIVVNTIRAAAASGLGVLVISHDMPRMLQLAHRIVVLRHGAVAEEMLAADATIAKVVSAMIGGSEVVADAAV